MYLGTVFGKPHLQHKRNEINETSSSPSRFGRDLLNKCCHSTRFIEKKENAHTRKDIQNWTLLNRNVINPYLNHIWVNNRINNHVLLNCLKHYLNFKHQSWATLFQSYNVPPLYSCYQLGALPLLFVQKADGMENHFASLNTWEPVISLKLTETNAICLWCFFTWKQTTKIKASIDWFHVTCHTPMHRMEVSS